MREVLTSPRVVNARPFLVNVVAYTYFLPFTSNSDCSLHQRAKSQAHRSHHSSPHPTETHHQQPQPWTHDSLPTSTCPCPMCAHIGNDFGSNNFSYSDQSIVINPDGSMTVGSGLTGLDAQTIMAIAQQRQQEGELRGAQARARAEQIRAAAHVRHRGGWW